MNPNIKKRNKSLNKYFGSQKEKQKLFKNSLKSNFNINNEYDNFKFTITNIAKQLNNISLKSFSHSKTNTNILNEKRDFLIINNTHQEPNQVQLLKIINNNSFVIKGINSNNEKNEIRKENENLKENIKFLLSQIKKYQKSGIIIEENSKNNFNEIIEKENEIKKLKNLIRFNKKRIAFLEEENNNIKEKYNQLKIKYDKDINNSNNINNTNSNNSFIALDENQLYQYNFKKNNFTNYYNYENSKNNIDKTNYNQKRYTFHKSHHTTDYSHNYLLKNSNYNNISTENREENINDIFKPKKSKKELKNIKYLSLITSANKYQQNKEIYNFPKTTKAYNTNSFLYKKTPIKSNINKSSMGQSVTNNYFKIRDSKYNLHKASKKFSSILYHKKNNNLSILCNIHNQNMNNINIPSSTKSYSTKFDFNENSATPLPNLDTSPNDLYFFPNLLNDDSLYNFKINEMKFSIINYSLMKNSSFNYYYNSTMNHSYDILLSISNGFLFITGPNTNYLYFYSQEKNKIFDLKKLNKSHNNGSLVKINYEQIMCISGINTTEVEMYSIKDDKWSNLPRMNNSHSESSYLVYNSNIVFSFFGYDYEKDKYINDIEYIFIKPYYKEKVWNVINININNENSLEYNLRSHSIFYRINKENNDQKEIFIVGGYNNFGRNNGLLQILIENKDKKFDIIFKKYEENKVKVKQSNQNLDKYNNDENIFLFQNEFYQYYDEEDNLFYNYNYDSNFNIHIIDNFTLKHTIYKNKLNN